MIFVGCLLFTHKVQNKFLLLASYFFYASFDYRFLILLIFITVKDFALSWLIYRSKISTSKRNFLYLGLTLNTIILCYFKYLNFFIENFIFLLKNIGLNAEIAILKITLPVGISFYIFKSISYLIDVFREEIHPVENIFDYALYLAFFSEIIAGPISRGKHIIPQIIQPRTISFDGISKGFYYVASGLFLKVFMSDNLSRLINPIFLSDQHFNFFQYIISGYAFSFQIYGDFAGYSWMAKGFSAIIGFNIVDNFNFPYFSRNPQQFWRRWHISLSTWLRDYLYIPLGGSRRGRIKTYRNLLITMIIGGLWHGANLNFIIWGLFHAILLLIYHFFNDTAANNVCISFSLTGKFINFLKIAGFFNIITVSWFFFIVPDFGRLLIIFKSFFDIFPLSISRDEMFFAGKILFYIAPVFFMQLFQYVNNDKFIILKISIVARVFIYVIAFYLYIIFGVTNAQNFIYAQF
ncbi:MAG: MBOAT family O-acyltransferase [Candidatus Electronema sp. VV]